MSKLTNANRITTLTYMLCGCLGYAIDNMEKYLQNYNLKLLGKDKYMFNQLKPALKRVQFLLNDLEKEAFKVMSTDEDPDEASLSYEDATHIYWYLFLLMVDRGGTDGIYDLRLMALCDLISQYKSQLQLPTLPLAEWTAFNQVEKALSEGKYSVETLKHILEKDESSSETFESKISRQNHND